MLNYGTVRVIWALSAVQSVMLDRRAADQFKSRKPAPLLSFHQTDLKDHSLLWAPQNCQNMFEEVKWHAKYHFCCLFLMLGVFGTPTLPGGSGSVSFCLCCFEPLIFHLLKYLFSSMLIRGYNEDHSLFRTTIAIQQDCHKIGPVHKWQVERVSGNLPQSCKHRQRVFHGDKLRQMVEVLLHGEDCL